MFGWRNRDRAVIGEVTTRPKCERGRRPIRTRGAWDERNTTKVTQGTYVACDEGILPGCNQGRRNGEHEEKRQQFLFVVHLTVQKRKAS